MQHARTSSSNWPSTVVGWLEAVAVALLLAQSTSTLLLHAFVLCDCIPRCTAPHQHPLKPASDSCGVSDLLPASIVPLCCLLEPVSRHPALSKRRGALRVMACERLKWHIAYKMTVHRTFFSPPSLLHSSLQGWFEGNSLDHLWHSSCGCISVAFVYGRPGTMVY